jgi:hypothetical protein
LDTGHIGIFLAAHGVCRATTCEIYEKEARSPIGTKRIPAERPIIGLGHLPNCIPPMVCPIVKQCISNDDQGRWPSIRWVAKDVILQQDDF